MVDNVSMEAPSHVTQNKTESTAALTQLNTHIENSMDTYPKNNYKEENYGERRNDDGDDNISSPKDLDLGCVSRKVESSISSLSGTTEEKTPRPPSR